MARFRYSMQSILDIKLKMETQAKQEFSAARAALDEEEQRLQELKNRRNAYETEARRLLSDSAGGINLRAVRESRVAMTVMDDQIEKQKVRILAAERTLEQARVKLTEVITERKTHEKLKEKAFEQFLESEKKSESKEIDELTSYVYGQKGKEQETASSVMA